MLIELVSNGPGTPEWLTTVLPFATLMLGALLGFIFSSAAERRKNKRDDNLRWHELVRTLSAGVFAHAQRIYDLTIENADLYREGFDDTMAIKARVSRAIMKEQSELRDKTSELLIIVPLSFNGALIDYVLNVHSAASDDTDLANDATKRLTTTRSALMREVRKYLELPEAR